MYIEGLATVVHSSLDFIGIDTNSWIPQKQNGTNLWNYVEQRDDK